MNLDDFWQPSRDLDAWIAHEIMGDSVLVTDVLPENTETFAYKEVPRYSTDIAAAWQVCEYLNREDGDYQTWVRFHDWLSDRAGNLWSMNSSQAAEKICLAALYAVGYADNPESSA